MSATANETTRRLLAALEQAANRIEALEQEQHEPIAVIAMSCRFPGGADTPERYWQMLRAGTDAVSEVPRDRWDIDAYYDADPVAAGKMYSRHGGFLEQVDRFDPHFFEIAPREAASLDPQHRLLLELTSEAFERANMPRERLAGSATGVFVGITNHDYERILRRAGESAIDVYYSSGNTLNAAAGRLSYVFGLRGPAIAVDTACSSSAVALHLACRALRAGDCQLALAAGVNLILSPEGHIALSRGRMLSPSGRCRAFDAAADGYVRGEGGAVALLKRLRQARADGDTPLAVIRGTAVNQDGASGGFTVPSGPAQQDVLRRALADAMLTAADVSYVEAHGTGTALGDPIEVGALAAVFERHKTPDTPLLIGSVKTNIGHLESAAGIAAFVKVVLALQHGEIPPQLHFHTPSVHVSAAAPIRVVDRCTPWPQARRVAGISAFGASGTNAHVIVEAAVTPVCGEESSRSTQLVLLSAKSDAALQRQRRNAADFLDDTADDLADIAYAFSAGRSHHPHRSALVADSAREAAAVLRGDQATDATRLRQGHTARLVPPRVAFMYTGHGAQHARMGADLLETHTVFRDVIERCDVVLRQLGLPTATACLTDEGDWTDRLSVTQPVVFALQVALSELYKSWGIRPDAVVGHSVGEYAAAHTAGVFALDDAMALIATRARLMDGITEAGGMVAVQEPESDVLQAMAPWPRLVVAAKNGPRNSVVSGPLNDVQGLVAALEARGMSYSVVKVAQAAHSPLMEPALQPFHGVASTIRFATPNLPVVSTVTGQRIAEPIAAAEYWSNHIVRPVLFARAIDELLQSGCDTFLEIGPHPVLCGLASEAHPGARVAWVGSLSRREPAWRSLLDSLGALYVHGLDIDWAAVDGRKSRNLVVVPTYSFDRQRCWADEAALRPASGGREYAGALLGRQIPLAGSSDVRFESVIRADAPHYFEDHRVHGEVVVAAATYVAMALELAVHAYGEGPLTLEDITFERPLRLPPGESIEVQAVLNEVDGFRIYARASEEWQLHARGRVRRDAAPLVFTPADGTQGEQIDVAAYYDECAARGVEFGSSFRVLQSLIKVGASEARARVQLGDGMTPGKGVIHPVVLDGAFQVLGPLAASASDGMLVPFSIERLRVARRAQAAVAVTARLADPDQSTGGVSASLLLWDEQGAVAGIEGFVLRPLARGATVTGRDADCTYRLSWQPTAQPAVRPDVRATALLISSNEGLLAPALAERLARHSIECTISSPVEAADVLSPRAFAHVILLHGLEPHLEPSADAAALDVRLRHLCETCLDVIRASTLVQPRPRLWLVTRGAQPVDAVRTPAAVAQASLWGVMRTAAMEHDDLQPVRIDLDDDQVPCTEARLAQAADAIAREILARGPDDEVVVRGTQRLVPELRPHTIADRSRNLAQLLPRDPVIRGDRAYVVTGGTSGLGLVTAEWLLSNGARHLVLAARREPGDDVRRRIEAWRASGMAVVVAPCDMTAADDVDRMLDQARAMAPLAGVVHSAGIVDDATLARQTWERFRRVFAAKVYGAWHLHELTAADPLDFFVLYSSTAGVLGSPGQANHAAANALLDALAFLRTSKGQPAISIDWGAWSQVGIAARHGVAGKARERGVETIDPELGMTVFAGVLEQPVTQLVVAPVNWAVFARQFPAGRVPGLLRHLVASSGPARSRPRNANRGRLVRGVIEAVPSERARALHLYVIDVVAGVLGISDAQLEPSTALSRLGLDSLMAIEIRNVFRGDLDVDLPVTSLLKGSNVVDVAADLAARLARAPAADAGARESVATGAADRSDAAMLAQLDQLSDDEVSSLLSALDARGEPS